MPDKRSGFAEETGPMDGLSVPLGDATSLTLGEDRSGSEDKRYVYNAIVDPILVPTVLY